MSFRDFYDCWMNREVGIKFHSMQDRLYFYMNWIVVFILLSCSALLLYLLHIEKIDRLLGDSLFMITMSCFVILVLFGTKIMRKRRKWLYDQKRILIKFRT